MRKTKIRNFRISEPLDQQLKVAAALAGVEPSTLLREFVKDGTTLVIKSSEVQEMLRKRYS